MKIISREEAGLDPARSGIDDAPSLRSHLFLHHSVTKSSDDVLSDWRAVQDAAFGRGFKDISYTFGVHITGAALEGRSPAVEGAHTEGFNRTGHAIVLIGNYENLEPTTEQIETVRWLRWWMTQIGLLIPTHSFRPHNLVQRTACPGMKAVRRFNEFAHPYTPPIPNPPTHTYYEGDNDVAVYKDKGDEEVATIRRFYLELLLREPESEFAVFTWIEHLRNRGYDFVYYSIADSTEGQGIREARRAQLGL